MMQLTDANLRYLLAIYDIAQTGNEVSSQQIARELGVTKPSVTHVLDALMRRGAVVKERYGKIYLTDRGVVAARYYHRLVASILADFPQLGQPLTEEEQRRAAIAMAAALPCEALQSYLAALCEAEGERA